MQKILDIIALVLLIIGGLNLSIVGIFDYDPLIDFSADSLVIVRTLFFIMGVAAIYVAFRLRILINALHPPLE